MIVKLNEPHKAAHLFQGWQETMIWSCLQHVMGAIYMPEGDDRSALALLADFGFLAGEVNDELIAQALRLSGQKFLILVPRNEQWAASIRRVYGHRAQQRTRWAIKKEYIRIYGNRYHIPSPNEKALMKLFHQTCRKHGILHNNDQIFEYLHRFEEKNSQISLFDM